jgi:hypothetical protein
MSRCSRWARVHTASVLVVGLSVVGVLAGCGADVERQEAGRAAETFLDDATTDPAAACRLLAPRTLETLEQDGGCTASLSGAGLSAPNGSAQVSVAGHSAEAKYPDDTVFLALFDDGWRVTAAGCSRTSPDPAVPYDCDVQGD